MGKNRPKLWERSNELFWDDEHISYQMLKAHLNPDFDGASRKQVFINKSLELLYKIIPLDSKILDLGCGPGLYTRPLSEKGYNVTGIDLSKRSIAYAKEHDKKTTYIVGNYLDLDFENEFDVITLIYCDFGALIKAEREIVLKNIYRALKPSGILIFDVFTKSFLDKQNTDETIDECPNGGFWSKEAYTEITQIYIYKNNNTISTQTKIVTSKGTKKYILWDTVYTKRTIKNELIKSNLEVVNYYGDISGIEYSNDSETMCIIARKL